jgi:hypothetical protein
MMKYTYETFINVYHEKWMEIICLSEKINGTISFV